MGFRGSLGDRNLWLQSKGNFGYPWEGTLGPSSCSQNITSYCPIQPLYNPYIGNIMWVYISGALPRVPDFCLWYKIAPYETLPKTLLVLWGWSWRLDTFKPSWQGWQANPHHLGCYLSSSEISYLSSRNPNFFENQQKNNSKVRSKQRKKTWNFIDWSIYEYILWLLQDHFLLFFSEIHFSSSLFIFRPSRLLRQSSIKNVNIGVQEDLVVPADRKNSTGGRFVVSSQPTKSENSLQRLEHITCF